MNKDYKRVTTVGSPRSACDMEEFKEKDDKVNNFQLHDAKFESIFIQEKDFMSGPENCSARTEPSIRIKQMSYSGVDGESLHRTTLECSKEFSGKYNCSAPCLAKDVTPTNISSASTSRPVKVILSMDVTRRNKNGKVESNHRNVGGKVSSTSNGASKMEKGKGPVIFEADDSRSSSNRREDGRENFECISSRGTVSTAKRARIYDSESEKLGGGKSLKRLNNGNLSFMNWVTSLTNGLTKSHDGPMEALQHPFQHMKGVISSSSIPDEERELIGVSHGTTGFRSIIQAVCNPDNSVSSNKIKYVDHQKVVDALKGIEGEKGSNITSCLLRERLNFGQHSSFPNSSFNFGDGEKENFSTGPVTFDAYGITPRANDIELHDEVLASSKRFSKHVCQVKKSPSSTMDSCDELMAQSRHDFQNSLWITRFSRGVSNSLDLSAQHKLLYLEAKKNRSSEKPQRISVSHTDSHGSARILTENYESKLQLTISSKYCERSKSMTSSFAQRLDALKHSNPSEKNKFCLFCGLNDHNIWECSEVVESKLEQYLKSIALYESLKITSFFCILCFQLDHWASSCPNASIKGNRISFKAINGFGDFNSESTAKIEHENHAFINYDEAIMLLSEGKKDHHQVLRGSTVSRKENKAINLCVDLVKDIDTVNADKMKMTTCFSENELKKSEFKPFCSHSPTSVMDEPKGIFVAVRKLRLSRMDVLRWMKSRAPHYNLCGFFLRLRIGKLEKGMGATGYYVGCINGTISQSSISVCVGSSTYSITSPFISNQDFEEDELMAWWFQNLRDGTKMPSGEELYEKFQLRLNFGF